MAGERAATLRVMSQHTETSLPNPALDLSNALASAVERGGAGVVQVAARRGMGSSGVVWSADGVIVAANHNVQRDEDIHAGLPDGSVVPAALVGRDPSTDLAVLRVEASGLAAPEWSDLSDLRVGNLVLGLHCPGKSVRAALGIVSALGEEWRVPAGGQLDRFVQTDLDILKGFSGGLLVDVRGRGLGLTNAGLLRGHAMAIPAATVRRVVEALLSHGRIRRGYLGIGATPVRLPAAVEEAAGQPVGLLVMGVQPESAADAAGILIGDVLVALDGEALGDLGQLQALLGEDKVGREVAVRLVRAGQVQDLRVTVGAR